MKRVMWSSLLIAVLITPVLASGAERPAGLSFNRPAQPLQFERIDDPLIAERLVATLVATGKARPAIGTEAVQVDWALPGLLIPAAGSLQGGGGTFFRSDVTLTTYGDADQEVLIVWLPRGVDGRGQPAFRTTIPFDTPPVTIRDFVGELGLSGLGALLIFGVEPGTTTPDEDALIHGFSRIWTPQPGSNGTVSQNFGAQDPDMMVGEFLAVSMGLRQDPGFRTNGGIVNLGLTTRTFTVAVVGETSETEFDMTLPPLSMQQSAIPAGNYGAVTLVFISDESDEGWAAYGTSVDNVTGDGWVSPASLPY